MKIKTDRTRLTGKYDERNLTISESGKNKYPSKKMFIEFLEQYKDIAGTADVWSVDERDKGEVTIHVKLNYKVKSQ